MPCADRLLVFPPLPAILMMFSGITLDRMLCGPLLFLTLYLFIYLFVLAAIDGLTAGGALTLTFVALYAFIAMYVLPVTLDFLMYSHAAILVLLILLFNVRDL